MRYTFLAAVAVAAFAPPAPADEPVFNDRKLSEWVLMLKDDPLPRKRRAAVVALGQLAGTGRDAATTAFLAIGKAVQADASPLVRQQAAEVLGQQKPDDAVVVVSDLAAAVRAEKVPAVRREVAVALGRFGKLAKVAAGPLADALADPDAGVQAAAADALGRVGPDAAAAAPALVRLVQSPSPAVRQAAVFALGRVEPEQKEPVAAAVVGVLKGAPEAGMRTEAVVSLGFLGVTTPAVLDALTAALADKNAEFRSVVVLTLGRFGPAAKPTATALEKLVRTDPDKGVRAQAIRARCRAAGDAAAELIPLLVERLNADRDVEVRVAILAELGGLAAAGKPALPALRAARGDASAQVREAATAAIQQIERPAKSAKN